MREGYSTVLVEKKNGITTITLNSPESFNALSPEAFSETLELFTELSTDEETRVIVLTGAGKHFCAGGNVKTMSKNNSAKTQQESPEERMRAIEGRAANAISSVRAIKTCRKPVIAMINGAAMGGGAGLALACDFRIVEPRSKIGVAFLGVGSSGDSALFYSLSRIVGIDKATSMMLLGAVCKGEEAAELGLATLAEEGQLAARTYELAEKLAAAPTAALGRIKMLSYEFFNDNFDAYALREGRYVAECSLTEDHVEGVRAFLEKRPPQFKGR